MRAVDRLEVKLAHVKAYTRRTKSGKLVHVNAYVNSLKEALKHLDDEQLANYHQRAGSSVARGHPASTGAFVRTHWATLDRRQQRMADIADSLKVGDNVRSAEQYHRGLAEKMRAAAKSESWEANDDTTYAAGAQDAADRLVISAEAHDASADAEKYRAVEDSEKAAKAHDEAADLWRELFGKVPEAETLHKHHKDMAKEHWDEVDRATPPERPDYTWRDL